MLILDALSKTYGKFAAVSQLSFSVGRGEMFGFLGPNGAGKTTTIRMLMGILVPTSGRATVDGLDCRVDRVAAKRHIGYLPDTPAFHDFLRGREILEFVAEMHGQTRRDARANAARLLDEFGLGDAASDYAINYSLGMKKKLGLACALIHDPPLLILDEPINGLDPRATRDVLDRLVAIARGGKTVFLSTHLLDTAERLCDRMCILNAGRCVAVGRLEELKADFREGGSLEDVFLKVTAPEGTYGGKA
jgi:ABC-2 type transport system ATP-binding protein